MVTSLSLDSPVKADVFNLAKILIIIGYAVLLLRTFTNAVKLLFKSKTINENLLVFIINGYFSKFRLTS